MPTPAQLAAEAAAAALRQAQAQRQVQAQVQAQRPAAPPPTVSPATVVQAGGPPRAVLQSALGTHLRQRGVPEARVQRVLALPPVALSRAVQVAGKVIVDHSRNRARQNVTGALAALDAALNRPRIGGLLDDLTNAFPDAPADLPLSLPSPRDLGDKALDAMRSVPVLGPIAASVIDMGVDIFGEIGSFALSLFGQSPAQRAVKNAIAAVNAEMAAGELARAFDRAGIAYERAPAPAPASTGAAPMAPIERSPAPAPSASPAAPRRPANLPAGLEVWTEYGGRVE